MRLIPVEKIVQLQQDAKNVRNVCILAHVDHGKTTLADSLLAANGVISSRLAGTLRFLDSRPDEQLRGITMKSSAVCICYATGGQQFLVNLIDSPGHVDFSGEVSTATRLCDGALLLVDVVEGVCPQTNILLKQAFRENIRPLLVLNKIDRLMLELKMTTAQAYRRLQAVVEQINSVAGEIFLSTAMKLHETTEDVKTDETVDDLDLLEDSHMYFSPQMGNVIFVSAADGWGFSLADFAKIFAEKIGTKEDLLTKTVWGDFYMDSKRKRIRKGAKEAGKKSLFEQLILDNIWTVYEAVAVKKDSVALGKIVASLQLEVPPRELRQADHRAVLKAVMGSWLPLAEAILNGICLQLPSPKEITNEKAVKLMGFINEKDFMSAPLETQQLKDEFIACEKSPQRPIVAFVSKMFAVEKSFLPKYHQRSVARTHQQQAVDQNTVGSVRFANGQKSDEKVLPTEVNMFDSEAPIKPQLESEFEFMAFARVYSGTLSLGQNLYILPPTYNPIMGLSDESYAAGVSKFTVTELYLMMGKELEPVDSITSGNVCAIGGLSDLILKVGTLSSTLACPAFGDLSPNIAEPILKVAIEPKNSADLPRLIAGLKLLNQADPSVKISTQETGEQVIMCAGEVHLQRCLEDLQSRFSNIELDVSEPIVPFMETVVTPTKVEMESNANLNKPLTTKTANKQCSFAIKAIPMPEAIVSLLEQHAETLAQIEKCLRWDSNRRDLLDGQPIATESFDETLRNFFDEFHRVNAALKGSNEDSARQWNEAEITMDQIWAFGPKRARENLLINKIFDYNRPTIVELSRTSSKANLRDFDHSVVNGFQLRCNQGPLCEEPLRGVTFLVERWDLTMSGTEVTEEVGKDVYGPLSGQIITAVKEGCKRAFQRQPQRLMLATYKCAILCQSAMALGKVYAVVGRRCGQVLGEEMSEGSAVFQVSATLPVAESFGFAEEIRKKTSGLATPQMTFSHWEVLNIDPFWVPKTEEELEHFGEKADSQNRARNYMNAVRRRKGLLTDEKIVEFAEKQRTLNKKVG